MLSHLAIFYNRLYRLRSVYMVSYFSEQLPALETSVLPEEGFHSVYVSAVENSGLFFVQLKSSEERLVICKPTSLSTFQVFFFGEYMR